jgi:DNA-directed RNA polymerase beta subunit
MENVKGIFADHYDKFVTDKLLKNIEDSASSTSHIKTKIIAEKDFSNHARKEDMMLACDSFLDKIGLVDHHKTSINDFYKYGAGQIIMDAFEINTECTNVREKEDIERIDLNVKFTDVDWSKPNHANNMAMESQLNPIDAEAMNLTYSASLYISVKVTATAYYKNGTKKVRDAIIHRKKICHAPVMVGSILCNTYMKTKEELAKLHEDPSALGGDLIVRGVPWTVCNVENITYNQPRVFLNNFGKEKARLELISKPGDAYQNSDQILIRLLTDGGITCEIRRDKLKDIEFPFYVIFRVLGWTRDIDIYDNIDLDGNMREIINKAYSSKYDEFKGASHIYDTVDMLKFIAIKLHESTFSYHKELTTKDQQMQQAIQSILKWFDKYFLPGIGSDEASRHEKLRYFAHLINLLIKCAEGSIDSTDRDSCKNKRIHPSGISYAKVFKTYYNAAIVQTMIKKYKKDFKNIPFEKVDLASVIHSNIYGQDFEQLITQTITSGNKSQLRISSQRTITNRLTSQQLSRKNQLMTTALLRQITTPNSDNSKSSERAALMRRVHPTYVGYICLIHSPEGEKVGLNKQIALYCKITAASNSELLTNYILSATDEKGPLVIPLKEITPARYRAEKLRNVKVNGRWIGCCNSACLIAKRFREMRRNATAINGLTIDKYVTIHWEETTDELLFWADPGRMIRPLFVVYNNKDHPEKFEHKYRSPNEIYLEMKKSGGRISNRSSNRIFNRKHNNPYLMGGGGSHDKNNFEEPAKDGVERFDDQDYLTELKETEVPEINQDYRQMVLFTKEHAKLLAEKKITIDHLVNDGIIEFISAEEQENMFLAPSIDSLIELHNDERFPFTHCDVPQSLIGITAATAPFANMNQTPRVTFQCNQGKSTCGYFALNYPYRIDKDVFLQYQCELPLVRTIAAKYVIPNGCNAIVAISCQTGYRKVVPVNAKTLASPFYYGQHCQIAGSSYLNLL